MKGVQKTVYYCDFCRKHGLSRHAMEKHERVCTLNPDRSCRWKVDKHPESPDFRSLALSLKKAAPLAEGDIEWLRIKVGGCPACMLAALRQSGVEYHWKVGTGTNLFIYDDEVARVREEERLVTYGDQW